MMPQDMFEKVTVGLLLVSFMVLYAMVSEADYQDALHQEAHYKEMVCGGHWPDYKGLKLPCD
jgi:hypothetical protein